MEQNWITPLEARNLVGERLGRDDIVLTGEDEIFVGGSSFKLYHCRFQDTNNGNRNIMLTTKVYRDVDNLLVFYETRRYEEIQQKLVEHVNMGWNRPVPQLLRQIPADTINNRRGFLLTRTKKHIPLSMLMRNNDPQDFSSIFTVALLLRAMEALRVLHECDFTHSNLKPEDILLVYPVNADGTAIEENREYKNHPIMHRTDFQVVFQNLENVKRYQQLKYHRSNRKYHTKFRFLKEDDYDVEHVWLYSAADRSSNNRRIPVSRKDDVLSLLYIIIHMKTGWLPWMLEFGTRQIDGMFHTDLSVRKKNTTATEIVSYLTLDIRNTIMEVYQLIKFCTRFSQSPRYEGQGDAVGILEFLRIRLELLMNN